MNKIMAYKTEELLKQARSAIEEHELFFIEDVVSYLPCSKSTFYDHFPLDSDESNELRDLLDSNRITVKVELRKKWRESDNATLQMGLMKLIATNEERKKLAQTYQDHTTDGKPVNLISLGNGTEPDETA